MVELCFLERMKGTERGQAVCRKYNRQSPMYAVRRGGGGEGKGEGHCLRGRRCVFCTWAFWVSHRVLTVVCVSLERVRRPLAGCGVEGGDGCLGLCVGLWFADDWLLLVGGACGQGVWLEGQWWCWGTPCV